MFFHILNKCTFFGRHNFHKLSGRLILYEKAFTALTILET